MATASSYHHESPQRYIYNPLPPSKADYLFPQFSQLPAELRLTIWEHAVSHERLLHIKLYDPYQSEHMPWKGKKYYVVLLGRHPISKLFHISRESRYIALQFYRAQLPYLFRWNGVEKLGILYMNPELDILKFDAEGDFFDHSQRRNLTPKHFARFAHDVWLKDPQRVGLANVALEGIRPPEIEWEAHLAQKYTVSLLREAIQRLKCVYFVCTAPIPPSWCYLVRDVATAKSVYPQEHPVMAGLSAFDRLSHDPRPINLKAVYIGFYNPRTQLRGWSRMLSRLQVEDQSHIIDYRCMVTRQATSRQPTISDRDTVLEWVGTSKRLWEGRWRVDKHAGNQQECKIAFGFWLFPIEYIEPDLDFDSDRYHPERYWDDDRVMNLSGSTSELCLFRL